MKTKIQHNLLKRVRDLFQRVVGKLDSYLLTSFDDIKIKEDFTNEVTAEDEGKGEDSSRKIQPEDLIPIKEFMEYYIGQIVIGMKSFKDDVDYIDVVGKMITAIDIEEDSIRLKIESIASNSSGEIALRPTIYGQFSQKYSDEGPENSSAYRINFASGICLEYLDSNTGFDIGYIPSGKGQN